MRPLIMAAPTSLCGGDGQSEAQQERHFRGGRVARESRDEFEL
jgi:hypothetical protein